ncbi:MAG: TatD family hydrolase [Bacteroides sp.]|nr:TatD family hydrolase [Roseburia sp.]MCM1345745.1 TatD family hydrolase [Bacteroides sp.]MCM1420160.1 TatD family hydrolase [Bacteroides sp.]
MYNIIDTHAHLDGEEFCDDISEVLYRAQTAGVKTILIPNINGATIDHLMETCKKYKEILHPMIGLHPEDVKGQESCNIILDRMETMLKEQKTYVQNQVCRFIAIGEIGLDFYWDDTYKDEQKYVFERQIEWAETYNLPLMIHSRSAHTELVEIMETHRQSNLKGVFHCFTGNAEEAKALLSFEGFMLGIGGAVTFKKSELPTVLSSTVPMSRIVLETDAPYLTPVPYRGKRNESAFIVNTAKKIADIYKCTVEEVAQTTTENAIKVFGASILY